ncbi:gliding motility lipoprotein GldD [Ichthyenterobacterium magnum]|uniref:Protein involved in gliding motility GldD n=1 Tax=Ichthyenterobacterium magnum TaxID=1230530 RepID=A0A420DWF8_9FLAO|nr:gliding motility lipoprotein GldD [Ichthyenterobacterium magnum]RKE98567.1 protein involved in gliding motility GldD [Ichthyenterobacterium magnum]
MKKLFITFLTATCIACGDDPLPKPKGFLRLDYNKANYKVTDLPIPFSFEKNELANKIATIKVDKSKSSYGLDINYPSLKGTIYLTYKKVTKDNLIALLRDAQNMTQKHVSKADGIEGDLYKNPKHEVYGMFYEVGGNAASQSQFYVTDSLNHFLSGSLYFYAKPNFDSIYPAAEYLKKDIKHIMETIKWKK